MSSHDKLIEALENAEAFFTRYEPQGCGSVWRSIQDAIPVARSLLAELAELREKVSKMENEWYSLSHMNTVEERTIKPLREYKEALEWLIHRFPITFIGVDMIDDCPEILKHIIEQKERT